MSPEILAFSPIVTLDPANTTKSLVIFPSMITFVCENTTAYSILESILTVSAASKTWIPVVGAVTSIVFSEIVVPIPDSSLSTITLSWI